MNPPHGGGVQPLLSWAPSAVWGLHWPQEHPWRQGTLWVPPAVRHSAISWNPGGTPLGWHPYLLHPGVPALGSLWTRQTWKHPPGPAILLLRGVRLFYTTLNCSYGVTGVLQMCRVHFLQWPSFERNEPVLTVDIPVFLLPYG